MNKRKAFLSFLLCFPSWPSHPEMRKKPKKLFESRLKPMIKGAFKLFQSRAIPLKIHTLDFELWKSSNPVQNHTFDLALWHNLNTPQETNFYDFREFFGCHLTGLVLGTHKPLAETLLFIRLN